MRKILSILALAFLLSTNSIAADYTKIKKGLFKESVYEMIMNQKENSIDLSRAVIKDIIEKYKGEIKIKNERNSSVLTFVLPVNQV